MVGLQYACIANCSVLRLEIVNLRSIRTKLALLVVTAVVSAVLLVCLAFAWTDASRRFSAKRLELQGIATTIATAVSLPLAAGDHTSIARTLGAVGRIPGLTYARVADVKGLTVQQFGAGIVVSRRSENTTPNQSISPFSGLFLETYPVMSPIIFGGRQIGEVMLVADLSSLRTAARDSLVSALSAGLLAVALGLMLVQRLQYRMTQPVLDLTHAIESMSRAHALNGKDEQAHRHMPPPLPRTSNDEFGILIDAFNGMSAQIRSRDEALARHREGLEREGEKRPRMPARPRACSWPI